jgi:hypothetical protein
LEESSTKFLCGSVELLALVTADGEPMTEHEA